MVACRNERGLLSIRGSGSLVGWGLFDSSPTWVLGVQNAGEFGATRKEMVQALRSYCLQLVLRFSVSPVLLACNT